MHLVPEWIEALIFDLGGVVIGVDFDRAFQIWEQQSRLSLEDIRSSFVMDACYEQHERGEIRAAEYFRHLRDTLKLEGSDDEIALGWNAIFTGEITQTLEYIRMLKGSVPCYAFTNSNPFHQAVCSSTYSNVVRSFDQVFVSSELGVRKPDYAAFKAIADATGLHLSTMLLFDDSLQNVEGALNAGMQAMHVRSPSDIKRALEAIALL